MKHNGSMGKAAVKQTGSVAIFGLIFGLVSLGTRFGTAQSLTGVAGGTKENLDLPYNAAGQAEKEEDAPEIITFYGQTYEGDGFFYILDRSGSMQTSGQRDTAKREATKDVSEFSEKVYFGVFYFDKGLLKFPTNGQPAQASAGMKSAAIAFIKSTPGGHGTCQQAALASALQMANLAPSKRKVLIYLSDGGGTCQGAEEATYLRQTLSFVAAQNVQRAQINTIGILDIQPINEAYMKNLASQNGGTYVRIR